MSEIVSGARAKLYVSGVLCGWATNVSVNEQVQMEPVKTLGSIRTREFAPTDYNVDGSAGFVRVVGEAMQATGLWPAKGATAEDQLRNLLENGELSGVLEDTITGRPLGTLQGLRFSSRALQVSTRTIATENASFVAILVTDEEE